MAIFISHKVRIILVYSIDPSVAFRTLSEQFFSGQFMMTHSLTDAEGHEDKEHPWLEKIWFRMTAII